MLAWNNNNHLILFVGDILIEKPNFDSLNDAYYWVIKDKVKKNGVDVYYAFDLKDPANEIGPVVFMDHTNWTYEVLRYD